MAKPSDLPAERSTALNDPPLPLPSSGDEAEPPVGPLAPGLYLVATPIGNARDITLRALDTLRAARIIAAEDTRVTGKLLQRYGIATPLMPYHDHNAAEMRPRILARLAQGEAVALVSDAGMPLISDPGYKLVRAVVEAGHGVTAVPGASAALTGLVLSGLPTDRFLFAGFLDAKGGPRRRALAELAAVPATLVLFEAGPRLAESLADMAAVLGDRPVAVARELTKKFEEVRRGRLAGLAAAYGGEPPPKGELVVVIGPPEAAAAPVSMDALLAEALGRMSVRDAADTVAAATGQPRRVVYARALALARREP